MYFEVILKIFVSLFAIFGAYCLICIIAQTAMRSGRAHVAIMLESEEDVFDLDIYLEDASSLCFLKNAARPIVLVERNLCEDPQTLDILKEKGVSFVIFDGKEK